MRIFLAAPLLAIFTFAYQALAAQPESDRFDAIDSNHDGKIILAEFKAAFPNMNEQAFQVIDLDGDKVISREEWLSFTTGHARGDRPGMPERGAPMNNMPGDPLIPPVDSSDLPLMRPPSE